MRSCMAHSEKANKTGIYDDIKNIRFRNFGNRFSWFFNQRDYENVLVNLF